MAFVGLVNDTSTFVFVSQLLSSPERLIDLAGPTAQEVTSKSRRNSKKTPNSDMALLKL